MVGLLFFRTGWAKKGWIIPGLIFIWILSGCGVKQSVQKEIVTLDRYTEVISALKNMYPDMFKARHRAILTMRNKDYALNGFLSVNRINRQITLMVQNDLGGTVFDFRLTDGQNTEINGGIGMLNPKWIENTLTRDLKSLYLQSATPFDTVFSGKDQELILSRVKGDIEEQLFFIPFHSSNGEIRLDKIRHLKEGRPVYGIDFSYGPEYDTYPEFIQLSDPGTGYRIKIQVQYFIVGGTHSLSSNKTGRNQTGCISKRHKHDKTRH